MKLSIFFSVLHYEVHILYSRQQLFFLEHFLKGKKSSTFTDADSTYFVQQTTALLFKTFSEGENFFMILLMQTAEVKKLLLQETHFIIQFHTQNGWRRMKL